MPMMGKGAFSCRDGFSLETFLADSAWSRSGFVRFFMTPSLFKPERVAMVLQCPGRLIVTEQDDIPVLTADAHAAHHVIVDVLDEPGNRVDRSVVRFVILLLASMVNRPPLRNHS